ncbi:teichoic acid transport system permease protein [Brevibacterium sanguinis]|uniref:Transport permease protein n=2 Tax=Brevibacterium TaxID=1696 RepID=A0A366IE96_9MICO|nr:MULTISPECIES: ABC transporter permease [Brevibacterium]RBP62925.1 teichoic acid transport system permease protein [Brevibacterium sanguinis]RBP69530.1 teichoic acid transport system permease protein [Brevibacterium celere]
MDMAKLAAEHGLERVGGRPSLPEYIKELWQRSDFTLTLARYRIQSENERNRLGMLWVVLRPAFSALIYGTVFGVIMAGVGARPQDFVPFVIIGVFSLEFFNSSMNGGAKSIIQNASLVQSLPFPRIVLPIATVMQNLLNFMPTLALMIILATIWGARPNWEWLLFIPLVLIFWVFNQGVAFIFARITVHFRDLSQVIPFISRMIFYTSGVFFDLNDMIQKVAPGWQAFADWHPLNNVLAISRGILMERMEIPYEYFFNLSVWAVVVFVFGFVFFWQAEERYGRDE